MQLLATSHRCSYKDQFIAIVLSCMNLFLHNTWIFASDFTNLLQAFEATVEGLCKQ